VAFHVVQPGAGGAGERLDRARLVDHEVRTCPAARSSSPAGRSPAESGNGDEVGADRHAMVHASLTVARMVADRRRGQPQATLAEEMSGITAASAPIFHAP
jgi:hypothetical protein